jgi:hypothetical protein
MIKRLNTNKEIAYRKILRYTNKARIKNIGTYLDRVDTNVSTS